MIHLNGNLLAVVDVETTGFIPGHHDVVQVCVLILNEFLEPDKRVIPFYVDMKPKRPENIDPKALKVNRLKFAQLQQRALDPFDAADMFDDWFEALKTDTPKRDALLPEGKKLAPVAQNWVFDRGFIIDWLGPKTYDSIFHPWYRDTLPTAQYLNDAHYHDPMTTHQHKAPFPKSNLAYLCSQLDIKNHGAHDALQDCIATGEVYRRMVLRQIR